MEVRLLLAGALVAAALLGACGEDRAEGPAVELVLSERATPNATPRLSFDGASVATRLEGGDVEAEWSNVVVGSRHTRGLGRARVPPGDYRLRVVARDHLATDPMLFECERTIAAARGSDRLEIVVALSRGGCTIGVS